MKAVHVTRFGDVDVLRPVDLAPRPRGPGDTVIAVEASGVNYADLYFRKGAFPGLPRPPFVLGLEGVGTVTQAPADGVAPGRRVAFATFGSYAEEVVIPPDGEPWQIAVAISDDMAVGQAAGLAMSGRTAVLLSDGVPAEGEGDTVLVYAGAGGVGWFLCQLLAGKGLRVVALVGSEDKKRVLRPLDLTQVINRHDADADTRIAAAAPHGFKAIFNAAGGATIARDLARLAPLGRLIWYGFGAGAGAPGVAKAVARNFMKSVSLTTFNGGVHTRARNIAAINDLATRIDRGTVLPIASRGLPLARASEAHCQLENGQFGGKIHLTM